MRHTSSIHHTLRTSGQQGCWFRNTLKRVRRLQIRRQQRKASPHLSARTRGRLSRRVSLHRLSLCLWLFLHEHKKICACEFLCRQFVCASSYVYTGAHTRTHSHTSTHVHTCPQVRDRSVCQSMERTNANGAKLVIFPHKI
jgi:hypothetical protein